MAGDGDAFVTELPAAANEEGLGFDIIGVVEDEVFVGTEVIFAAFFDILFFFVVVVGDLGIEVGFFVWLNFQVLFFEEFGRFFDEGFGSFFVFVVGVGKSPVGHGAVGVLGEDGAEGAFGFVIPKAVKLTEALVEVSLTLIPGGGDGEVDVSGVFHEGAGLARALVKSVPVVGVTFFDLLLRFLGREDGDEKGEGEESFHDGCL